MNAAFDEIMRKALVASGLDTAGWDTIIESFRQRAFFSAQVAEMRLLHELRDGIAGLVSSAKSPSEIRRDARALLSSIGYDAGDDAGTIKDLTTKARLDLIIRTNAEQAKGFANHIRATNAGAILAFPAYELIRVRGRRVPRDWDKRWRDGAEACGYDGVARGTDRKIALKTSPIWKLISRFGNPFPPFDFNSGMGVRDIKKSVCRELGLLGEDEQPETPRTPDFNGNLRSKVPFGEDSPEFTRLKSIFGDQVVFRNGEVRWSGEK